MLYKEFDLNNLPKKYYVYIYLDITKPGEYKYDDVLFNYEPFYVGKGKNKRAYRHVAEAIQNKGNNRLKINKINKIIKLTNNFPLIIIYADNITNIEACKLETELIKSIGRRDLHEGSLVNLTNGGEGTSGFKHKEKTLLLWSRQRSGKNHPLYGKGHNDITKDYMKNNWIGENNNHYGKKQSEKQKQIVREINSKSYIVTFPDGKKEIIKNLKKFCKENNLLDSKMCLVAQGKRNHHKKFKCEYLD